MATKRTLYIGSAAIRFSAKAPYVPAPSETLCSEEKYGFSPDGRALLSAVASLRLGYEALLCAQVGDDYYGDRLIRICREEGLRTSYIGYEDKQTELFLTLEEQNGASRTVRFPGAGANIREDLIASAFESCPDAVVASLTMPASKVLHISELAHEKGIPLILEGTPDNTAKVSDFPLESLQSAGMLILSEADLKAYSGISPSNEETRKLACYTLNKRLELKYLLLQLGERGCFLYDGKYFSALSSEGEDPVDRSGASEAFTAALIGSYLESGDMEQSAIFANRVYAKAASVKGSFHALPKTE